MMRTLMVILGLFLASDARSESFFQDWKTKCETDKMTDEKKCMIYIVSKNETDSRSIGMLFIHIFEEHKTRISFQTGKHNLRPGFMIRVDKSMAVSCEITCDDKTTPNLLKEISGGQTAIVRNGFGKEFAFNLPGFKNKFDEASSFLSVGVAGIPDKRDGPTSAMPAAAVVKAPEKKTESSEQRKNEECLIKGAILFAKKTYFKPEDANYNDIVISTERGERVFCSEEEAGKAGFSPVRK